MTIDPAIARQDIAAPIAALIAARQILYLDREAVIASGGLQWHRLIAIVAHAYAAHDAGDAVMPKAEYLRYPDRSGYDRMIALFGYLGGDFRVSGLKQICSATGNAAVGFPRASGLIILNDPASNRPFAILEATAISAARTAAVTALAFRALIPATARTIAIIGCGDLAHTHLAMLQALYPPTRFALNAFDPDDRRLALFCRAADLAGIACRPMEHVEQAVRTSRIVLPMTTVEAPHIRQEWIQDHGVYCAVSLLDADLAIYRDAKLIMVDDLDQCLAEGRPLQRLAQAGALDRNAVVTLGAWLREPRPNVDADDPRPVVFNPMGTVVTDLAAASSVFAAACAGGLGLVLPV